MKELTKGTWIINSIKHLMGVKINSPELSFFDATEMAGKSGMLLSRLVADEQEIIPSAKVKAFSRESGITRGEILSCLNYLKKNGKIDFTVDSSGNPKDVEVYCFSTQDALLTTSKLYNDLEPSDHEQASLISLDRTFRLPYSESELISTITSKGFSENIAVTTLMLQDTLELVKVSKESGEPIYYNEYAFAHSPEKIAKALRSLSNTERNMVEEIQGLIEENPGFPFETLSRKFPSDILKLMEGVGLLDGITVYSDIGGATFVTLPQLKGISIDVPPLSADAFHKAKVLLSCLRFGEVKSQPWRGRIESHEKMINIVKKLVRGEWVGPCTAIGHDYQLLEKDGVITTRPAKGGMYMMRLRQREVGILVKQMLELKRILPEADIELQRVLQKQPVGYIIPEQRRSQILAKQTKTLKDIRERFLQSIRTGMR